jgi:phosphate transport system substrate-binding protein
MFSAGRKCGQPEAIDTWGQAGMTGPWAERKIQLYGRNSVSGTYGYFKEHAICKGDFRDSVNEQPGSASVVQAVSNSINGAGYSGMGYTTSSVRGVPLAKKEGAAFVPASAAKALTGEYPLSRFLYVYVNKAPNAPLPPLEAEFLKMVLSKPGQAVVAKDGFIPLPASVAAEEQKKLAAE